MSLGLIDVVEFLARNFDEFNGNDDENMSMIVVA
jgi:hypothetical protein